MDTVGLLTGSECHCLHFSLLAGPHPRSRSRGDSAPRSGRRRFSGCRPAARSSWRSVRLPPRQAAPTAQEVAASLQKKYDTIRDFSTDFVHTHEGGVLKRKREERGTLLVKKPGKMRWDYKAPDEKVFVSDGVRLTQYFADENRAVISAVPENDQAAVLFLVGKGNLTRDFNVSFGQSGAATAWTLRLEPKQPQQEYDWLEVDCRPRHVPPAVADRRRQARGPVDVRLHELQGKPRTGR